MKKKINLMPIMAALCILLPVNASAIETDVIDEKWGKPIYVYGSGLSENEVGKTAGLLDIKDLKNVNIKKVTGEDEIKYLGSGSGDSSAMISSVLVQKKDKAGVDVEIRTPENITQITPDQYRNAAITAGIHNCQIVIAAVRPVTGESALTGIYKAYDANGEVLDTARMKVAQEELETTNTIVQENKDKKGFSIDQFNQVIVNVKQELNNYYSQEGKKADMKQIEQFINDSVKKYELNDVITSQQVEKLSSLFNEYQNTGAINSQEVLSELNTLAKDVSEKAKAIYQDAKDAGILDKIGEFFSVLFESLAKFINSNK